MTKVKPKSLNKEEENFKNKKHRVRLYERTFLKHNIESRLFTLQKEAINLTSHCAAAALEPTEKSLLDLAEAVGDVETYIEVIKLSIPKLQDASASIKQQKLLSLKNRTDGIEEAAKLKPEQKDTILEHEQFNESCQKTAETIKKFGESIPKKKGFFYFFRHLKKYFTK